MIRVLVSACLLGERVRYDGGTASSHHPTLQRWHEEGRVVPICPEVAGGLGVPRAPAERREGRVVDCHGRDVTAEFEAGARAALAAARAAGARIAILKARSPSCGVEPTGIAAALLAQHDIAVFSEAQFDTAAALLETLEPPPGGAAEALQKKMLSPAKVAL